MKPVTADRRRFLAHSSMAVAALSIQPFAGAARKKELPFKISLAQWTINRELKSGKIDNLDLLLIFTKSVEITAGHA